MPPKRNKTLRVDPSGRVELANEVVTLDDETPGVTTKAKPKAKAKSKAKNAKKKAPVVEESGSDDPEDEIDLKDCESKLFIEMFKCIKYTKN